MKIYKTKWYNCIYDSKYAGTKTIQVKNGRLLSFRTKKDAINYANDVYGKEYTNDCICACRGKDL